MAHPQENISAQPVSFAGNAAAPLKTKDDGGTTLLTALNKAAGTGRSGAGSGRLSDRPQPHGSDVKLPDMPL
jgi:hypothetical protein